MPPRKSFTIPDDVDDLELTIAARDVRFTSLGKMFWPKEKITKRDLLQYYADIAPVLLPHLVDRAMVMKRYPNGAGGKCFFMKRAPSPRPEWVETCTIDHKSGNVIDFPIAQDLPALLWLVNLGCIDMNPWYARCDDVHRPDYVHFDLDPVPGATFATVRKAALVVRDALDALGMRPLVKTNGVVGNAPLRPDRTRPDAEAGLDLCEGVRGRARCEASESAHFGIPDRAAACRAGTRGLQSERVGPDAGVNLLTSPQAWRHCINAGYVG